ncbi:MAG: hypothetical protein WCO42_07480 [bacterium]
MRSTLSTLILILLAAVFLAFAAVVGARSRDGIPSSLSRIMTSDAPPGVRFVSVALGGFRGLLADILWVRAANLQEAGKFFEVAQLADWITRLEPRYPEVWAYHAWNMSYNITAVVSDPADRWHWIKNGIRLLRDEGIPSTPSSPSLYWELGWTFYDKVGGRWDEATPFYRISWAADITRLLGSGVPDYSEIERHEAVIQALDSVGLKVDVMKSMENTYGPLDWRLPETHALYWGYRGREFKSPDSVWCDRLVWMALTETVKDGTLLYEPNQRLYQRGPQLDVAAKGVRHCAIEKPSQAPLSSMAMVNFLRESALTLYAFQRPIEAEAALAELKNMLGSMPASMSLDKFVTEEIDERMKGMDLLGREKLILNYLVRSDVWRRSGNPVFSGGYDRLAKRYWNAMGREGGDNAWQALQARAHERALAENPIAVKP